MKRGRLLAIARKELRQLRRDPPTLGMLFGVPIIQLVLFGFAIRTDVRDLPLAIWDSARTSESRELAARLEATGNYVIHSEARGYAEVHEWLTDGRVRAALDKVGLLDREKLNPVVLSGGEQQRVGIARALVHKPELLLADEPTGNLDPTLSWEIMQLFQQFNSVGVTVLIATHDIALINQMNKRQIQLAEGRLVADIPGARR